MATSGSFNTSGFEGRYLQFSWKITSQSVTNNTTTISWTLKGAGDAESSWYNAGNFEVVIDGKTVYSTASDDRITLYDGTTVASGTFTFTHNADGTRSFSASAQGGIYYYAVNCTGSGSFTLNTIPRASQPSCITYPEHTQNVGEFGDVISIHMNRHSSAFTHTVRYAFGSRTGTCINAETGTATNKDVTTGFKWKIPEDLMDLIPSTLSGSGTIYVDTYNGTTLIGTKSCGFTATVPASVKPSCTATLDDITGVDDIYLKPVKGLSKIKITVSATTARSSPIDSYEITANGVKYDDATATTDFLRTAGTSPVTVKVTDKRGRTGSWSYNMTVLDYTAPAVTALSVMRCNADGTVNRRGGYVKATFSAAVSSMAGHGDENTAAYSLKYKKTSEGEDAFTTVNFTELNNNFSPTGSTHIFEASTGNSYDVVVLAVDRHNAENPAKKSAKAPTAAAIFSWRGFKGSSSTEDGAGIGKVPEKANTLQVGWKTEFDGEVVRLGNRYVFSSPGVASTAGFVRMAQLTHKKANADTPITFVFTRRLEATPMTVYVQFKTDSTTVDPDLKNITYEGSNYGAFLVRSAASVWDLYVEKVSAYDTITLQDWFSSATLSDRMTVAFPGDLVESVPAGLDGFYRATPAKTDSLLDHIFPVGSIYFAYNHTSPASLFGGTWTRIENAFLWATTSGGTIGQTGGESTHTLTVNEIPSHKHIAVKGYDADVADYFGGSTYNWGFTGGDSTASAVTGYTVNTSAVGGGKAHNNMPPYIQVSAWRRTA